MIAVALSPKARALIQAHRNARRPTAADRERVTAALRAQLGSAVLPLDTSFGNSLMSGDLPRRSGTAFSTYGALGICVVGSVLLLAPKPGTPAQTATAMHSAPVETMPSPAAEAEPSEAVAAVVEPAKEPSPRAPAASRRARTKAPAAPTRDLLAQEVLLLSNATSQLSSGQATSALLALDEHQRRFSNGALSDERNAAKARALCVLHRFTESKAALALVTPGTPFAARVKEECDLARSRTNAAESARKTERD